jgi:hypothetical protein
VDGEEAFILHPGEFVLGSTLERVTLPDDLVARLEGKALALDTEIPTPSGWRLIEEIRAGDTVFDELGQPTLVLAATPPMYNRPCREVVFSDGSRVVCDEAHQWSTWTTSSRRRGRRREEVHTTAEIERSVLVRGERNHHVRLCEPVDYPERELPVDPYVLGTWIGGGTRTNAGTRALSYRVGGVAHARNALSGQTEMSDSLTIPTDYLRASVTQRQALLEGLLDTDGSVDADGRCDLTTIDESLARQYFELVASMGFRPTVARKRAVLDGRDCRPTFEVRFVPDRPVFRFERKRRRQKATGARHRFRAISDVRAASSVPVRCIQVASPSGLFLVTRAHIPTHNSSLGRLGLLIHSTAGFIDPGWDGHVTLELSNVANLPITIYPGMKIGQLSFVQLSEPAERPYGSAGIGSKYQGQRGPTPSRYWQNFERE